MSLANKSVQEHKYELRAQGHTRNQQCPQIAKLNYRGTLQDRCPHYLYHRHDPSDPPALIALQTMQRLLRTLSVFTSLSGMFPILLEIASASAILFNITVDDSSPDPYTGNAIIYTGHWDAGQSCSGCVEKPDPVEAYNSSWHDASYDPFDRAHNNIDVASFTFIGEFSP